MTERRFQICYYRPHLKNGEGYIFTLCVSPHLDGGMGSRSRWGGPRYRLRLGGYLVSGLGEGEGGGGYPVSVKGKIFDIRFGLIHVQTGKKIFVKGPPPSKGKLF